MLYLALRTTLASKCVLLLPIEEVDWTSHVLLDSGVILCCRIISNTKSPHNVLLSLLRKGRDG
jgi:hypothetical protein